MNPRCLLPVLLLGLSTVLRAQTPEVIPLWPDGAPGSEVRRHEPEQAKDWWVKNIHNPSVTVFTPPKGKASGTAVVICPGGGHREIVFNAEGVEPAQYLAKLGVTAFVLKYRLAREPGSSYSIEKDAAADLRRAMRLIRSRAREWGIEPGRLGVLGFSAGAELAALVTYNPAAGDPKATDPIEQVSARPDFQIIVYPGPVGVPEKLPADSPPAFFLCANDDESHAQPVMQLVEQYRTLHIPVEVHLYAAGGHGFNMGDRSDLVSIRNWPQRMADWLADRGLLTPAGAKSP
jgi:acetyl esterase/lipase